MRIISVAVIAILIAATALFSVYVQFDEKNADAEGMFTLTTAQKTTQQTVQKGAEQAKTETLLTVQEQKTGTKAYFYGSSLMASKSDSAVAYYHKDYLGSVRLQSGSSREKSFVSRTAPFGPDVYVSGSSAGNENNYKFTGQESDSNLYYYGARYYDTKAGRFTQLDPVPGVGSPYAYVTNNPLLFTDPTGKRQVVVRDEGEPTMPVTHVTTEMKPFVLTTATADATAVGNSVFEDPRKGWYTELTLSRNPEHISADLVRKIISETPQEILNQELSKIPGLVVVPEEFRDPRPWIRFLPVIDEKTLIAFSRARAQAETELGVRLYIMSAYRTYMNQGKQQELNEYAYSPETSPHRDPRAIDIGALTLNDDGELYMWNGEVVPSYNWGAIRDIMTGEGFLPYQGVPIPPEEINHFFYPNGGPKRP